MKLIVRNARSSHPILVILRFLFWGLVSGTLLAGMGGAGLYVFLSRDLPEIPPFDAIRLGSVSSIAADAGMLLGESFTQRRYLVSMDRIPDILVKAVIASEDERFFEHSGTDLRGIMRALVSNLRAGKVKEGASTITQQLARSLLLSNERSFKRKAREGILARRLEDIYTKDQILALYLNVIYLGEGCYGVEAASRMYFGRPAMELTASQAATIAALPQSPSSVTPWRSPDELKHRRDRVLNRMQMAGALTSDQAAAAIEEPMTSSQPRDNLGDRFPFVAMDALGILKPMIRTSDANVLVGGNNLHAETTIDAGLQFQADLAAFEAAMKLSMRQGWRGPVARLEPSTHEQFLKRNREWIQGHAAYVGASGANPLLALVTDVSRTSASVSLTVDIGGEIPLEQMKWAVPYTEFDGERLTDKKGSLSLDGNLKDATEALQRGDVVLVMPAIDPKAGPLPGMYRLIQFPAVQAALVAMDQRTGYIKAMTGGWDFDDSQYNRVYATRQTGSVVKPVYYSRAYDIGIPPSTVLSGAPFKDGSWNPTGTKASEDMTLFLGLTRSENRISLRAYRLVLDSDSVDGMNEWATRLGLVDAFKGYPSEALGIEQKPAHMMKAYGVFASGGLGVEPTLVKTIGNDDGRIISDHRSSRDPLTSIIDSIGIELEAATEARRRVITTEAAFITAANLRNVAREGTGRAARQLQRSVFGKTGTLSFDVWFAGWTHELTTVAWMGQDNQNRFLGRNRFESGVVAARSALPMWIDFIEHAAGGRQPVDDLDPPPPGIVFAEIDPQTGLLSRDEGIVMPHIAGTEPQDLSPLPIETIPWVQAAFF